MSKYPQLDAETLAVLMHHLEQHHRGNRSSMARELGLARSSLSMAIDGTYPADTHKIRSRIINVLIAQVDCPHLGRELARGACQSYRERTISEATGSRGSVRHWQACQSCPHNPAVRTAALEVIHAS